VIVFSHIYPQRAIPIFIHKDDILGSPTGIRFHTPALCLSTYNSTLTVQDYAFFALTFKGLKGSQTTSKL